MRVIFAVLLTDMLTKFLIVTEVSIIDGVLAITPTQNFGAGFSVLSGQTWLLITITFVFLIGIVIFDILFKYKSTLFGIGTGLIVSGAIGNLIDRLAFGYVRDFIYLEFIDFPVFNVADMALTFGVILLAIYIVFFLEKSKKQHKTYQKNTQQNNLQSYVKIAKEQLVDDNEKDLQDNISTNEQTNTQIKNHDDNIDKLDM